MGHRESTRRLVVNADDFGGSAAINRAVIRAHQEGILTTASLMVNGAAFEDAVASAYKNPNLGVGLHLCLVCGHSTLPQVQIPGLVDRYHEFSNSPVRTGFRYFAVGSLRRQLESELAAQWAKFRQTGLALDHVNGHLNLQLHPTVFRLLMDHAQLWGLRHFRLTYDPLWLNLRLASGFWGYRLSHAFIFGLLSRRARPRLRQMNIRHTNAVFGLLQTSRVDEQYVLNLLPRLPAGDSELYSHPSLDQSPHEFAALVSPKVAARVRELGIKLVRYQDL